MKKERPTKSRQVNTKSKKSENIQKDSNEAKLHQALGIFKFHPRKSSQLLARF